MSNLSSQLTTASPNTADSWKSLIGTLWCVTPPATSLGKPLRPSKCDCKPVVDFCRASCKAVADSEPTTSKPKRSLPPVTAFRISTARLGSCRSTWKSAPISTNREPAFARSATAATLSPAIFASWTASWPVVVFAPQMAIHSPGFGRSASVIPQKTSDLMSSGTWSGFSPRAMPRKSGDPEDDRSRPKLRPSAIVAATNATPRAAPSLTWTP